MERMRLPELLAPAGSPDALYAAIDVSEKKRQGRFFEACNPERERGA